MKGFVIAGKWILMLCLPILLLAASIGLAVNSHWFYEYDLEKYAVSQTTGIAGVELEKAAIGLIAYFNSGETNISLTVVKDGEPFELFNQREVAHLRDVKGLIRLDYWILLGMLTYTLGYAGISLFWRRERYCRQLARGIIGGSGITLALMLAMGLGIVLNFDQLFLQFHLLSFTNELWQLDPARDYLIMLFPRGFWYDAAIFCALTTSGLAIILSGTAGGYLLLSGSRAKVLQES